LEVEKSVENKVWYLRQNRLFAKTAVESIGNVEHIFTMSLLPKRTLIFDQGDPSQVVYLIKRGRVRISRVTADGKEVTVAMLAPGDIFGEDSLFGRATRTTVAACMEETLICKARADDLFGLLSGNPTLALNVAQILSDRLGDASATIEDLAVAKVSERLMHLFERLSAEHGRPAEGGTLLDVRLTHHDLASVIGSTRETVTVEIAALVRAGKIRHDGRYITLLNPSPEAGLRS
jgi:CRP/FNR family cyclic AMP-dependent transcriptional regulator